MVSKNKARNGPGEALTLDRLLNGSERAPKFLLISLLAMVVFSGFGSKEQESDEFKKVKRDYDSGVTKFVGGAPTFEIRDNRALQYELSDAEIGLEPSTKNICEDISQPVQRTGSDQTMDSKSIVQIEDNDLERQRRIACGTSERSR